MPDPSSSLAAAPAPRRVVILGSTGSIGTQTLDVLERLGPERAQVVGVAARRNAALVAKQARTAGAAFAAVTDDDAGPALVDALAGSGITAGWGAGTLAELAAHPDADTVVVAVAGVAALLATLAACRAGKRVCIATKEVLVAAGTLVMATARACGAEILPVDSEHSAIFQCVRGYAARDIARIYLTASGGPFRTWPRDRIEAATIEEALNHPTWRMGGKITIDSASLMNKGLEIIEARWLFDVPLERVRVVVHPQSIVHSFVELQDGALLAQLGPPDMRLAIQIALVHPEKVDTRLPRLDPVALGTLTFEAPDEERFPALRLSREAGEAGGVAPAVLNAANEAAVGHFLAGRIAFGDICRLVESALAAHGNDGNGNDLEGILAADRAARHLVDADVAEHGPLDGV
jgi:1-deoxy-D-xylulose-5-phosphate reductoisomerase